MKTIKLAIFDDFSTKIKKKYTFICICRKKSVLLRADLKNRSTEKVFLIYNPCTRSIPTRIHTHTRRTSATKKILLFITILKNFTNLKFSFIMKKLFTLFAGLTMFLSSVLAVDHLYLIGDMQNWNPANGIEMTNVAGNVFTYTLEITTSGTKYFAFTSVQGGWTDVNANRWGGNPNNQDIKDMGEFNMQKAESNFTVSAVGIYVLSVDLDNLKLTVSAPSPVVDPTVTLNVSAATVEPNTLITLTAEASNFEGEVSYAYSYSTTGAEPFTALAGNTFTPEAEGTYTFKVVATDGVDEASATKVVTVAVVHYYLKHPWGTGADKDWSVKELNIKNGDGTYSLFAAYGGKGCNYGTTTSTSNWEGNPTVNGAVTGDWCKFTYNPADNSIVIDKVTTSFNVAASAENGDVAVSAAEVLDHQPATFTATNTVPGYFFTGWYSNEALTEEVSKENPYTMPEIVESTTLYAKFEAETTYTITLVDATEESVEAGATVNPTITAAVKPGFTFKEWTATDGIVIANAASATTTISATAAGTVTATYDEKDIFLKNGWGTGSWSWKQAANNGDGTYTINNYYSKTGYNVNTKDNDTGSSWVPLSEDAKNGKWVTATYNDADASISIVESMPTATLAGSFNAWAQDAMVVVDNGDNTYSASLVQHLAAGDYEFKVVVGGAWLGNTGTMTRENCTGWTFAAGDNCGLTADIEGDYTFTLTITAASIKLSVAYPVPTQTLTLAATDGEFRYATFSSAKAVEFAEDVVYIVKVAGGVMSLEKASQQVPANNGVLIKSSNATVEYQEIAEAAALAEANLLYPASKDKADFENCLFYKLAYGDAELTPATLGFYWGAADGGVFASREGSAYLAVPTSAAPARFLFNETTALEHKTLNAEVKKALIDGKIVIFRGGNMFDLNGRIVK